MVVTQHENPLDDGSPVKQQWHVPQGVCGFAWISVRPGNCGFAHWLKKQGLSKGRAYGGGVQIWVSQYGQSYELKMAYAQAAADVLKAELGGKVRVYASGRLD
jgi:hypothetical protein